MRLRRGSASYAPARPAGCGQPHHLSRRPTGRQTSTVGAPATRVSTRLAASVAGQPQVAAQLLRLQRRTALEDLHPADPALPQQGAQPLQRERQHVGDLQAAAERGRGGVVGVEVGDRRVGEGGVEAVASSATRWARTTAGSGS